MNTLCGFCRMTTHYDICAVQVNYHAAKDCVASDPDGPSLFLLRRNAAS